MPSPPGWPSTRANTTKALASSARLTSDFFAVEDQLAAAAFDVRLVSTDIGAGVRLGHADREQMLALGDTGEQPLLHGFRTHRSR